MKENKKTMRHRRVARSKMKIRGTAERPRLRVFRSNTKLYAQLIHDTTSSIVGSWMVEGKNIQLAQSLGKSIAKDLEKKGIRVIVFDRSGFKYHGVIAALAQSIRDGGIRI